MTKSTITRERAQQIFLGNGPEPSASEERELARMALAAMDSEPVAEVVSIYGEHEAFGEREIRPLVGIQQMPYGTKLYRHAQPASVADAADNFYSWFGREWAENYQHNQYTTAAKQMLGVMAESAWKAATERQRQKQSVSVPDVKMHEDVPYEVGRLKTHRDCYCDGWNACRAAMLQAGNSPAQSDCCPAQNHVSPEQNGDTPAKNQGWIPVNERMPEEGGRYWCYVEEQNSLGKSHYQWNCSWNGDVWSDKALTGRVTHWMPLPAAPQEAINALISVVSRNEPEGK
ncbi:TPA: DUF551 domain-containing protein [Klebsiella pneumoniae]|nr:DUF551 domain-containing protein [Klebsiella pneumoniae]